LYGVRVAVHAHHFPCGYNPPAALTPDCVDGMPSDTGDGVPKWSLSLDRLTSLFRRLVGVTGFNTAMVMTSKSPLSMFHAFAASHFACRRGCAKDAVSILKTAVKWLLNNENGFKVSEISIQHSSITSNNTQGKKACLNFGVK
jgi:hypothetical protein